MLKAIVLVTDENDKILWDNRLIFETNSRQVAFGIAHDFNFTVVTPDEVGMKFIKNVIVD